MGKVSTITIQPWDSAKYGGDRPESDVYLCEVDDSRKATGQIRITLGPESGEMEDYIDVMVEVNHLPGTSFVPGEETVVPCFHVALNADAHAFSVFQAGSDKLMLRLEAGMELSKETLTDGEVVYMLKPTER